MLDAKNILLQVVVKKSVLHCPARALDTRQNLKKKHIQIVTIYTCPAKN